MRQTFGRCLDVVFGRRLGGLGGRRLVDGRPLAPEGGAGLRPTGAALGGYILQDQLNLTKNPSSFSRSEILLRKKPHTKFLKRELYYFEKMN